MEVIVLYNFYGKIITDEVCSTISIYELQQRVKHKFELSDNEFFLTHKEKMMVFGLLQDYNVRDNDTIYVIPKLITGIKKQKSKLKFTSIQDIKKYIKDKL